MCSHRVKHLLQILILLSAITLLVTCITVTLFHSSSIHVARNMRFWSQESKELFSRVTNYRSWEKGVITQISPPVDRNCAKLMNGDKAEVKRVSNLLSEKNNKTNTSALYDYNTSCSQIKEEFLNNFYTSEVERMFPIAFTLVVHKNAQQTVRFLKAIYRPHNLYCIHPDPNSGEDFTDIFKLLSQCLSNVFLPAHIHNVTYDTQSTIFEAQLCCLRELEKHPSKWYYVINLCSRELPLKTNRFIVESLRALNGTSIVRPHPVDKHTLLERFPKIKITSSEQTSLRLAKKCPRRNNTAASQSTKCTKMTNTTAKMSYNQTSEQPPVTEVLPEQYSNLTFYKSMAYNALSHQFVHFFLHNYTTQVLLQWMIENVHIPEEHFYATVYMMPAAPGGFYSMATPSNVRSLPQVYKSVWKHDHSSPYYKPDEHCASNYTVHHVCILTSADLPQIKRVMEWNVWFFNKFFMEDDHVVMDCVEKELVRNNKQEFIRDYPDSLR